MAEAWEVSFEFVIHILKTKTENSLKNKVSLQ